MRRPNEKLNEDCEVEAEEVRTHNEARPTGDAKRAT
jgi:hypothetical protein